MKKWARKDPNLTTIKQKRKKRKKERSQMKDLQMTLACYQKSHLQVPYNQHVI